MKIADLAPHPTNPRTVSTHKLAQLKKALAEFGDLGGVVFNRRTDHLVGGHQRVKSFDPDTAVVYTKKYSKPTKTGTVAEGYFVVAGEKFSYREVDWSDAREKAANLAANKNAGEWDLPQVGEWLKELASFDVDFDMDLTMFDAGELKDFSITVVKEHVRTSSKTGVDEDDFGPGHAEPRAALGDVWKLGRHRVMCGSSTDVGAVNRLLKGAQPDITFTSPPYNAAKNASAKSLIDRKYQNTSDAMEDEDYLKLLTDFTDIAMERSRYVFVNLQLLTHNRGPLFAYQHRYAELIKDILIWNKRQCPPNIVKGAFNTKWEYVFCFSQDRKTRGFPVEWQGQYPNVVETESNSGNEFAGVHKAGFPVAFPEWFLEKFDFAQKIYEPFCGTGTTVVAAEKLGRTCYGMELDPRYVDVILYRWEQYTGEKAVRVWSSKTKLKKTKKPAQQAREQGRAQA